MAKCSHGICGGEIDVNISIVSKLYAKKDMDFANLHECLKCGMLHHEDGKPFMTQDAIWGITGDQTQVYLEVRRVTNYNGHKKAFLYQIYPCPDPFDKSTGRLFELPSPT